MSEMRLRSRPALDTFYGRSACRQDYVGSRDRRVDREPGGFFHVVPLLMAALATACLLARTAMLSIPMLVWCALFADALFRGPRPLGDVTTEAVRYCH